MGKRKGQEGASDAAAPHQPAHAGGDGSHKKKKRKTLDGAAPASAVKATAVSRTPASQEELEALAEQTRSTLKPLKAVAAAAKQLKQQQQQAPPGKKGSSKATALGAWLQQAQEDYLRAWSSNKALTWRQFINGYQPPAQRPAGATMTVRQLLSLPPERLAKLSVEAIKNLPHPVMLAVQQRLDTAGFCTPEAAARHPTPMLPLREVPVSVHKQPKLGSQAASKVQKRSSSSKGSSKGQKKPQAAKVPPCAVILPGGRTVHTDAWNWHIAQQPAAVKGQPPLAKVEIKLDASTVVTGRTDDPNLHSTPQPRYAVGLFDKYTHKLRLVQLAGDGTAIRLQPRIKGVAYEPKAATAQEVAARTAAAADLAHQRQRNVKLVEEFGSTRRQRTQRQREEGMVRAHKLGDQENLQALMEGVQARGSAAGQTQQALLERLAGYRNIPPHHSAATTPEQAYVLPEVFPGVWGTVNSGQLLGASEDAAAAQQAKERHQVVPYVWGRISSLAPSSSEDAGARKQRAKALTLLNIVLKLLSCGLRVKAPRQHDEEDAEGDGAAAAGTPLGGPVAAVARKLRVRQQEVLEGLLDQFYHPMSDGQGWEAEPAKLELLLLSGLVLALAADGWSLSTGMFDGLRSQLKRTSQDLASKFRELGATCKAVKLAAEEGSTATTSYTVTLLSSSAGGATLGEKLPKIKVMRARK